MYYELERLLKNGERCVITGIKGSGKSTLISKFSSTYNSFRSMWYCSEEANKSLLDKYQLFDRCNFIDRYAYQYSSNSAKEACIYGFKEVFEGVVLILLLNNKWKQSRQNGFEDTENVSRRMVDISVELLKRKIIKYLIISTEKGWWSSEFADIYDIKEELKEEGLYG
jgi:ABC-type cobalamin/Fe3+-siderophores transport system ATPase subunit